MDQSSDGDHPSREHSDRKLGEAANGDSLRSQAIRKTERRRTFGQLLLDRGASIESVSVLMGHDTTKTTESYYCRMKEDKALAEVSNLWP